MNHFPPHLDHQINQSSYCDIAHQHHQLASQRMRLDQQQQPLPPQVQQLQMGQGVGPSGASGGQPTHYHNISRQAPSGFVGRHYAQVSAPPASLQHPHNPYMHYQHFQNHAASSNYNTPPQQHQNILYDTSQDYAPQFVSHYAQQVPRVSASHQYSQVISRPVAVSQGQQPLYQSHQHHQQYNPSVLHHHQHQMQQQQQQHLPHHHMHQHYADNNYHQPSHLVRGYSTDLAGMLGDGADDEYRLPDEGESFYQADTMDLHPTIKQQEEARQLQQQQENTTNQMLSHDRGSIDSMGHSGYERQNMPAQQMIGDLRSVEQANESNLLAQSRHVAAPSQQIVPRSKSDLVSSSNKSQYDLAGSQPRPLSNDGYLDHEQPGPNLTVVPAANQDGVHEERPVDQQRRQQQHRQSDRSSDIELRSCDNLSQDWLDSICRHLIEHMNRFGICVIDNFLGSLKGESILEEVRQLYNSGRYSRGRLVSSNKFTSRTLGDRSGTIRNDRVIWIDGYEDGCSEINNLIQTLCSVITNSSRLSLYSNNGLDKVVINKRTRAHVACYPGNGTRYIKHVDNPNDDGRVITSIYYLNKDWNTKLDGGLLRMFPAGMDQVANIEPLFDRVLFFWSDRRNPHEVLPAYKDRFAITVWYIGENRPI